MYVGVSYVYSGYKVKDTIQLMAKDPNFNEFGTNINKAGIAFSLIYESRDVIVNACKGLFY